MILKTLGIFASIAAFGFAFVVLFAYAEANDTMSYPDLRGKPRVPVRQIVKELFGK